MPTPIRNESPCVKRSKKKQKKKDTDNPVIKFTFWVLYYFFFKIVHLTFYIKVENRLVQQRLSSQSSERKHKDQLKTPPKHTTVAKMMRRPTDMTTKATT
jgi:hypothetical protein